MTDLPIVMTLAGAQPTPPATLLAQLIAAVTATNPGYTANLPGTLVEDISSTDVFAVALSDQARVELVNSLTPLGANLFLLNQLGQIYGVYQGAASNPSVYCVFTGPAGWVIAQGFTVSDGTYLYTVQDSSVIATGGTSSPVYCLATQSGSWSIPAGSVTQVVTSVQNGVTITVTNPQAGTPGGAAETEASYRARVLQAGLAASQGMPSYLKTLLSQVPDVQPRLISIQQPVTGVGWEVICGGGDPYEVANAIFQGLFDITALTGSVMSVSNITKANPGVVTTVLNHGLTTGETAELSGVVGMTSVNGVPYTITVVDEKNFSIGVDTSSYSSYVSGGVVSPNPRNIGVTLYDYPDTYGITFVNPPQQTVTATVTWNTSLTNFTQQAAVAQLGAPALVAYINAIPVGQPLNLFEMQAVFGAAIANVIPPQNLTRLVISVAINGIGTSPTSGTGIIPGDPESYFEASSSAVTVTQG